MSASLTKKKTLAPVKKAKATHHTDAKIAKRVRHETTPQPPSLIIIRVRGSSHSRHTVETALHQLHLNRRCHATIANVKNAQPGVLQKVKDYVTWGPADAKTIELLLSKRGETRNGQKLTDALGTQRKALLGIYRILVYVVVSVLVAGALFFGVMAAWKNNPQWYIVTVVLLGAAAGAYSQWNPSQYG